MTAYRSYILYNGNSFPDYKESRLFGGASEEVIWQLSNENVTYNYHRYCYTEQSFTVPKLNNSWRIMSLNHDLNGFEFVSTIEHLTYPFYGVQFHPEKSLYEFVSKDVPHSSAAVHSAQYFADFFINEARRNSHSYANTTEQALALIYNYKPEYTSIIGSGYVQQYLFEDPYRNAAATQFSRFYLYFAFCGFALAALMQLI